MNLKEILDELPPEQRKRIRDRAKELMKKEGRYYKLSDVFGVLGNNEVPFTGCDMESIRLISRVDKFIKDGNIIPEVDNADKD